MHLSIKTISTVLLLSCFMSPFAYSQTRDQVLRIGTMELPPYGWSDSAGAKKGIIYDLNEEIGKRSGMKYKNTILPFKRMLLKLKNDELDIVSSQAHKASMEAGDKLSVQFDINVIAGTRKSSGIKTFNDLKGKSFVYHQGASYSQLEGFPRRITRVSSYQQSLSHLHSHRSSHAAVFSEPAYYYWMKELGLSKKDFGEVIMIEKGKQQWIFVRKNMPEKLRAKLKVIVDQIYNEKMYDQLLNKYGKEN